MKNSNTRQRGFTLVEILVVIVIVGLLAGIVGPKVFDALTASEEDTCRIQVSSLYATVQMYALANSNRLPDNWDELIQPDENGRVYLDQVTEAPKDPWGNEYEIRRLEGRQFEVRSWGPDEIPDTDDDISSANAKDRK